MKKILVAIALAMVASAASATVENSAHDFNISTTYGTNQSSRCVYCHVPHGAQAWANVALWATGAPSGLAGAQYYSNDDYQVTTISVARSQTCLACHADGTTATTFLAADMAASKNVGFDLRNDHPIGDQVQVGGNTSNSVKTDISIGRAYGVNAYTATNSSTLECATCHAVHGLSAYTIQTRKLLYGPGGPSSDPLGYPASTDFCGICHTR